MKAELPLFDLGIQMDIDCSKIGKKKPQPITLRRIIFNAIIYEYLLKERSTEVPNVI